MQNIFKRMDKEKNAAKREQSRAAELGCLFAGSAGFCGGWAITAVPGKGRGGLQGTQVLRCYCRAPLAPVGRGPG